jgi:hypothetical protein
MITTRTLGPLHLEDLEPHRFEDLVRQLVYDFRNWRSLEATGRSGSDDGFDARGFEIVGHSDDADDPDDDVDEQISVPPDSEERTWLVQCKREKEIGPTKLIGYVDAIPEEERAGLYGIIFAAACDFSKTARDAFRVKARELGFAEAYLWGKGEIEDALFQPKNDHLLFAYFGVSLQVRQRSMKTQVRARLATKRKALRSLNPHDAILIRDASDDRYPYLDPDRSKTRFDRGRWIVKTYEGTFHDGLHFVFERHFAYLSEDGEEWDYAESMDDGPVAAQLNPWSEREGLENHDARTAAMDTWRALPERTQAWFEIVGVIPFGNIIDIDEKGDDCFEHPHIYTTEFDQKMRPFQYFLRSLTFGSGWSLRTGHPDDKKRVEKFPRREGKKKSGTDTQI